MRFHVNVPQKCVEKCEAIYHACFHAGEDNHFTNEDAALRFLKLFSGTTWTSEMSGIDPVEARFRGQVLFKNDNVIFSFDEYDEYPEGTLLRVRTNVTTNPQLYIKMDDGIFYSFKENDTFSKNTLSYNRFHKYIEVVPTFDFSVVNDFIPPELVESMAAEIHETWRNAIPLTNSNGDRVPTVKIVLGRPYDLANTEFKNLPEPLREENRKAGVEALRILKRAIHYGGKENILVPAAIHESWNRRNPDDNRAEVPYRFLSKRDKLNDMRVVQGALNGLRKYFR